MKVVDKKASALGDEFKRSRNEWVLIEWVYGKDGKYKMKQYGFRHYEIAFEKMRQLNGRGASIVALVKERQERH